MPSGLTWKELRDLRLSGIEDAADGWAEVSDRASSARTRVDNEMTAKLRDSQEGEAEKAAVRRLQRLSENFHYIHVLLLIPLLVSCGMLAGEGGNSDAEQVIDVNMQEAAERADSLLDETLGSVKPGVEWAYGETTNQSCTDWKGEAAKAGAVSRRRAVTTVISAERRGSFLGVVERYWKKRGHRIIGVNKDEEEPAIYAETSDGFRIRLMFGHKGQAFFKSSTPCAEKSDVSPPESKPGVPEYTGEEPPLPDKHSEFWSARTPVPPRSSGGS